MRNLLLSPAVLLAVMGFASSQDRIQPQILPEHIVGPPRVERVDSTSAIIRWTTNTGASHIEYGVVRFGTDPKHLSQVAKSPNRWNPDLPKMTHRVQLTNLNPATTYFYVVSAERGDNTPMEGVSRSTRKFVTSAR
jgi:phosphodiesterase/alkaline phosphatase D-like protein